MRYRFENFLFDTDKRELRRLGQLKSLEPQVFDLLEYLITSRDRVVTRDEIIAAVWHDRIVSDGALSTRINAVRRALDDDGVSQRLVQTIRTKGFRFVGVVEDADQAAGSSSEDTDNLQTLSRFERPNIAVLPFLDMSDESAQNKLADALTEELITSFAKSDWMSVAARCSTFEYKNKVTDARRIARRLRVRYLLEGSVRQSKGRARVIVRLVDGLTGGQIWSERYDGALGSLDDGLNDKIAAAVVQRLYLAGLCAEGEISKNPGSWEFITRILFMMNSRRRSQVETAREVLKAASKLETTSAKICSLLSFAVTLGVQQGWQRQDDAIPIALHAAEAALTLNSDEPWAHLALGYARIWRKPEEAFLPIERALKLNPQLAMGHFLFALASVRAGWSQGIPERAELGRALKAFDLLAYGHCGIFDNVRASACLLAGRHREGIEFARRAIAESPLLTPAYRQLVVNCALADRRAEARSALAELKRMSPNISLEWINQELKWSRAADQRSYVEAFRVAGLR